MTRLDWLVVALYLAGSLGLGLLVARRGARSGATTCPAARSAW